MARANEATLDNVTVGYGTRDTHNVEDAVVHTYGRIQQAELRIDHSTHTELASGTAPDAAAFEIPTGAAIKSAKLIVLEGFTDLTSIVVGTKGSDGVAEDADGLIASTALAAINTAGQTVEGAGAQIDGVVTDEPLYVSLDVTGTAPTAGEAVLVVEYYQPVPSSTPPAPLQGVQGSL